MSNFIYIIKAKVVQLGLSLFRLGTVINERFATVGSNIISLSCMLFKYIIQHGLTLIKCSFPRLGRLRFCGS